MNEAEREAEFARWLQYAQEDLRAAQKELTDPSFVPRHACYDAQQAVEKAIKGVLILLDIEFSYRHDLEYLNSLLPRGWQIDRQEYDLELLTSWAASIRYPGDMAPPSRADAGHAVQQAENIVRMMEAHAQSLNQ